MTLEIERKIWVSLLLILVLLLLAGIIFPKQRWGPPCTYPIDPHDYQFIEWRVRYSELFTCNESMNFSLQEGIMYVTAANLNQSVWYWIGEIRFDCTGAHFTESKFYLLDITNKTFYVFMWETRGDINNQYGVGIKRGRFIIGMVYPYYEKV